jgi:hypothetical protein
METRSSYFLYLDIEVGRPDVLAVSVVTHQEVELLNAPGHPVFNCVHLSAQLGLLNLDRRRGGPLSLLVVSHSSPVI